MYPNDLYFFLSKSSNMTSSKVLMWNCGGLRPSTSSTNKKLDYFHTQFTHNEHDLRIFIETHHQSEEELHILHQYTTLYHLLHSPATEVHDYSGIIILLNKNYTILNFQIMIPGRLVQLHCLHSPSNQWKCRGYVDTRVRSFCFPDTMETTNDNVNITRALQACSEYERTIDAILLHQR